MTTKVAARQHEKGNSLRPAPLRLTKKTQDSPCIVPAKKSREAFSLGMDILEDVFTEKPRGQDLTSEPKPNKTKKKHTAHAHGTKEVTNASKGNHCFEEFEKLNLQATQVIREFQFNLGVQDDEDDDMMDLESRSPTPTPQGQQRDFGSVSTFSSETD